jgi:hypothetical protein
MNDFAPASKDAAFAENDGFMRGVAVATNWLFAHSSFLRRLRQWQLGMVYFSTHDLRRRYFPETLNATELEAKKAAFESIAGENVGGFSEVEKIAQIAREHRIELLAVLTPNEVQLYREDFDGINTRIRDFCSSKHIEFYDPLPALRAHALKAQVFLDGLHFSPIGHAFIAEWMLPFIKEHLYLTSQRGIEEPG